MFSNTSVRMKVLFDTYIKLQYALSNASACSDTRWQYTRYINIAFPTGHHKATGGCARTNALLRMLWPGVSRTSFFHPNRHNICFESHVLCFPSSKTVGAPIWNVLLQSNCKRRWPKHHNMYYTREIHLFSPNNVHNNRQSNSGGTRIVEHIVGEGGIEAPVVVVLLIACGRLHFHVESTAHSKVRFCFISIVWHCTAPYILNIWQLLY